jgi:CRP/FNR family cyclic AMP-dependent transcriptional regulator
MGQPVWCDAVGYFASALVLTTFCQKSMYWLRMTAIASNFAFMAYGYLAHLPPVLGLHIVLLPINLLRLAQLAIAY